MTNHRYLNAANNHQPAKMRIAVIGPGALGTLFAARLAQADSPTLLLDYRSERAARLNERGLVLQDASGQRSIFTPVSSDPRDLAEVDAALVLVKAYQTEQVAAMLAESLPEHAAVLTLQNGLGNVETLQMHLGQARVFGGTTAQGALLDEPGTVRDTGSGPIAIGRIGGQPDPRLDDLCQALLLAGFSVSITCHLQEAIWGKVILNAAINAVGALTRLRNGQLAEHPSSRKLMAAAAREAFHVARRHGVALEEQDWEARLETICHATAPNRNSMLQDVLHERRTEIDAINGAIVRIAEQHEMPVPVNRSLWYLINTLECGYLLKK